MAPPTWKLLLDFEEGSTFSSRQFPSVLCPCRCCWCEKCEVKHVPGLPFSGLPRFYPFEDTTKQPSWSLVLIFAEGSEFPSRPLQSSVGLCRYCWCEKREPNQIQELDLRAFQSLFSLEATESLKELLQGVKSTDVTNSLFSTETYQEYGACWTSTNNSSSKLEEPISLKELLQQQSDQWSECGGERDSSIQDDQDPTWTDVKSEGSDQDAPTAPKLNGRNHHHLSKDRPSAKTFKTFVCPVCKLTFGGRKKLDQHMQGHDRPYECCLCLARFETRQQKGYHFLTHKDESGQYRCSQCNYTTKHSGNMPLHMRIHSDQRLYECDQCPMSFRHNHILEKHKLTHPRKNMFWCMECHQSFPSKNAQLLHLRKHNPTEPFKCSFCEDRFKIRSDLLVHQRTHMEDNGRYKCVKCNFSAITARDVVRHMIPVHFKNKSSERDKTIVAKTQENTDGEKEQIPRLMSKSTKKQLRASVKPPKKIQQQQYNCSLCESKFSTNRKNHMKQHKNEAGLYQCRKCDYACELISGMINHNNDNHKEVEKRHQHCCCYCGKSFPELGHLKLHRKEVHSGEKQYKCYQCHKVFSSAGSGNLKRHMLIHTGERPYQCSQCTKSFQTSDNFKRHQQVVHKCSVDLEGDMLKTDNLAFKSIDT